MLGRLARRLRGMGIDCAYTGTIPVEEVIKKASDENRTLITRDTRVMKRRLGLKRIFIKSDRVDEQVIEFVVESGVDPFAFPFTRCIECNTPLEPMSRDELPSQVPLYVRTRKEVFARCPSCNRIYWSGMHRKRMALKLLELRWQIEKSRPTAANHEPVRSDLVPGTKTVVPGTKTDR